MSKEPTYPPVGATRPAAPPRGPTAKELKAAAGQRVIAEQLEVIRKSKEGQDEEPFSPELHQAREITERLRVAVEEEGRAHIATREAFEAKLQVMAVDHSNQLAAIRSENDALREGLTNAGVKVGELREANGRLVRQIEELIRQVSELERQLSDVTKDLDAYRDAEEALRP